MSLSVMRERGSLPPDPPDDVKDMAVIVPDPKLRRVLEKIRGETGMEMSLHMGLYDDAAPIARRLAAAGARVLISRGETATIIRNCNLPVPVLEIPITECDVTPLLVQALRVSPRFAVAGFGQVVRSAQAITSVLGPEVEIFQIESVKAIPEILAELERRKFTVVIGNPQLVDLAQAKGMIGFPLTSREETVMAVLREAMKLVDLSRSGFAWQMRHQALLETTREKFFLLDSEGRMLNSNTPDAPLDFTDFPELLDAVQSNRNWSGIITDRGQTFVCKANPVYAGEQNCGAIVLLESARPLAMDAQRENLRKGFIARVTFEDILCRSERMKEFIGTAKRCSQSDAAVLIQGESGSGKELLAQSIHNNSLRRLGPFVSISCSSIPAELMESELFGYQGGAFTGARKSGKSGLFELAHNGTVFLDEIGELPMPLQAKLLRVLEEKSFLRIGGDRMHHVDVRVIAATNRALADMVRQNAFRDDLYFRLAVLRLDMPPLRERKEDIPLLLKHYLARGSMQNNLQKPRLDEGALALLRQYPFPGNVRELRSIAERLAISCPGGTVSRDLLMAFLDFPETLPAGHCPPAPRAGRAHAEEAVLIRKTLAECGYNRACAARVLGLAPSTLWRKCKKLGIAGPGKSGRRGKQATAPPVSRLEFAASPCGSLQEWDDGVARPAESGYA
jgi:transcriptional regulator with PAS, ATPase and Fis domain